MPDPTNDLESQMRAEMDPLDDWLPLTTAVAVATAAVEAARQEGERAGVLRARNIIRARDRDLPLLDLATIDQLAAYLDRTLAEDYPL